MNDKLADVIEALEGSPKVEHLFIPVYQHLVEVGPYLLCRPRMVSRLPRHQHVAHRAQDGRSTPRLPLRPPLRAPLRVLVAPIQQRLELEVEAPSAKWEHLNHHNCRHRLLVDRHESCPAPRLPRVVDLLPILPHQLPRLRVGREHPREVYDADPRVPRELLDEGGDRRAAEDDGDVDLGGVGDEALDDDRCPAEMADPFVCCAERAAGEGKGQRARVEGASSKIGSGMFWRVFWEWLMRSVIARRGAGAGWGVHASDAMREGTIGTRRRGCGERDRPRESSYLEGVEHRTARGSMGRRPARAGAGGTGAETLLRRPPRRPIQDAPRVPS